MVREEEIVLADPQESEPLVGRKPQSSTPKDVLLTEKPQDAAAAVSTKVPELKPSAFDLWGLASVILAVLIALLVVKIAAPNLLRTKIWTPEELAKYSGTDATRPLLLGVLGSVFDVSRGKRHYGPGGGYHHFTGRDASRAFVSGNFTGDGLTNSLHGLTALEVKSIDDWKIFFQEKYKYMGKLVGPFYDEHGKPTEELARVAQQVAIADKIKQKQKEDEKRFPSCSSRWNAQEGGEVWCQTGYPRIVDAISEGLYKGSTGTRCACFEKKFLGKKGLKVYDGCSATAQKCQSAPPEVKECEVDNHGGDNV
ncbi:unnamed protein product [Calypogeia fissa]